MGSRMTGIALAVVVSVGATFGMADTAEAASIIIPGASAGVEGDSNNGFPFNLGAFGFADSMRYQQIYAAGDFGVSPLLITGISFRPDGPAGNAFGPSAITGIDIRMSTAATTIATLSDTFADNVGLDEATVFSGNLVLSSADTGPGPRDFDISIVFDTPFLYDPGAGDLLFDVRNPDGATTTTFFDAVLGGQTSTRRVFATDIAALTGSNGDVVGGLVTRFETRVVPEPGTIALFGLGLVGLGGAVMRRRRKQAHVVSDA